MKHDPKRLGRAKQERERGRALLALCNCTWPLDTYRNGSGHDSSCPVHKRHKEARYERESEDT